MEGCRNAAPADVPRIAELARALRHEIEPIRGGPLWAAHEASPEPLEDAYRALIERGDARVVIGTIDDVAIGFAVGESVTLHDGRLLGIVRDLYVEPEARGIGVGETMVEALLEFFTGRGCVGADAWALPGHRMTKNFFEGHGFVSRGIVLHRPLPGDTSP